MAALQKETPRGGLRSARDILQQSFSPVARDSPAVPAARRLFDTSSDGILLERLWALERPWAKTRCIDKIKNPAGVTAAVVLDQHALYVPAPLADALFTGFTLLVDKSPGNPISQLPLPGLLRLAQLDRSAFEGALCVLRSRDNSASRDFSATGSVTGLVEAGNVFAADHGDTLVQHFGCIVQDVICDPEHGWKDALDAGSRVRQLSFSPSDARALLGMTEITNLTIL